MPKKPTTSSITLLYWVGSLLGLTQRRPRFPLCARLELVTGLAEEGADARLLFDRHPLGGGAARYEQDNHGP